jgi:hypothetical protein
MKEIIYLVASRNGVKSTVYKNLPTQLNRGEIPMKVTVEIAADAFAPPVIEQSISIQNPYKGIDLEDVHFSGSIITEAEAEMVRQKRLERAAEILRANGYEVAKEPVDDPDSPTT